MANDELIQNIKRAVIAKIKRGFYQDPNDEYQQHIDALVMVPGFLTKNIKMDGLQNCNEEEIEREHEKTVSALFKSGIDSHLRWGSIDHLNRLDSKLANCKYKELQEKWEELMLEISDHYAVLDRWSEAARVQYLLGNLGRARAYFKRGGTATEELIKITPVEELAALRDQYVRKMKFLQAGKIEWYLGNKEKAVDLLIPAEEFNFAIEECKRSVARKHYLPAIKILWRGLRLPFYRETMMVFCGNSEDCVNALKDYDPSKDIFPMNI